MNDDAISIDPPAYGAGDQVSYTGHKTYADGYMTTMTFIGSLHGAPGPVFVIFGGNAEMRVEDPGQFGDTFDRKWVRAFMARDI